MEKTLYRKPWNISRKSMNRALDEDIAANEPHTTVGFLQKPKYSVDWRY